MCPKLICTFGWYLGWFGLKYTQFFYDEMPSQTEQKVLNDFESWF